MWTSVCHIIVGIRCEKPTFFEGHLWFRRTISRLRYWYCERFHLDLKDTEPAVYVKCLDPKLFLAKDNANPFLSTVRVLYPNAEIYNQKLAWLNYHLVEDKVLPNDWCIRRFNEVPIHRFLINDKGSHLDPILTLAAFKKNALLFLQRTEALATAETSTAGHNARVTADFRKHLLEVFRTLIFYTHHD